MTASGFKRIPYGVADFEKIQCDNLYYVDKTAFIPQLEAAAYYIFLIRPRRFGKSLWVSVLENYYDINKTDRFQELFRETYIGQRPTGERNSYLILTFNFSMINPDVRFVDQSFEANGKTVIHDFLERYRSFFDEEARRRILSRETTADQLREVVFHSFRNNLKIYLLIDEYDNFANTILSAAGESAYKKLTHGPGFFRYFFNLLKGGTSRSNAGLSRLFITGVSPIVMDDVTSGFNIGENISVDARFNSMMGFDVKETQAILNYYAEAGGVSQDLEACLSIMKEWYNNYRFSKSADQQVFNSDMVLYFVKELLKTNGIPDNLIDQNIRIDYGKLRHLILTDQRLNGNFSQLKQIMENEETVSDIALSFPLERLTERVNFASLLFFFGLLSFDGIREGMPLLRIPNRAVLKLMYGYLRDGFNDIDIFRVNLVEFSHLIRAMAYRGQWREVFDFLSEEVKRQTSVRDYLQGEKVIQGFLLAYLNVTDFFLTRSEQEMNKGFADIWLEPFLARFPDMKFGYLIELKYISRGEFSDALLRENIDEARHQLERYSEDERVARIPEHVAVKKLALVFNGWELAHREEILRP